ncbi:MAG: preprotein translocase subunit YajC [Flavobacteriaceae bacterium]|nr:preprotein translocase subunit YajC [Flavobacteriaceae bacterium]MCY4217566.1 preprotein translocase subunit YajC [Flavobacteriaceae bacterium]MCY4254086.1 preprotein translocase subunit YajC [Flavobacteriaceae bacterium]
MEGMSNQLPFLLLIFVVFFLFIILPQQRRVRREKVFQNNLKKGDKVITKSGIHGKLFELVEKDTTVILETMAGKIKIERSAISTELSTKLNPPPKKG